MKISKRQLKRIIREEKARLSEMHHGVPHGDTLKKHRAGYHGGTDSKAEAELEKAVYGMVGNLERVQGYSQEESRALVVDMVKQILGM